MKEIKYVIDKNDKVKFNNYADYCIGTGRMGLALQKEYFEQLKLVQEKIGFKYIRGHGLFCDDMAIYQEYKKDDKTFVEYNFTYLDFVMDSYKELGLRPFLELGFMPAKMASGDQTVFYWKGNVTPPKNYDDWAALITATLKHLMERYGTDEVLLWPIEVWNEPNLRGFWKDADMDEYFKLFDVSIRAIKKLDSRFKVGGPAICGVDDENWMRKFLQYCSDNKVPLDFITRHHYTIELPEIDGHYGYVKTMDFDESLETLNTTRKITDSYEEFKNFDIHITEFNTSYSPKTPIHDTNYNAALVARLLSRLGDMNRSYSYWTFGDIFEEGGVPFTTFHGGFGLVANGQITKPTFWTFEFFKKLSNNSVHRSDNSIVVKDGNIYKGILWNPETADDNQPISIEFDLPVEISQYFLLQKTVDEICCNPFKVWHDMGEPANPSKEQIEILRSAASPLVASNSITSDKDRINLKFILNNNAVIYFELKPIETNSDRGFDYKKATTVK